MKVIISHDVDHLSAWEHKSDLTIPKFLVRSIIEKLRRGITLAEFVRRLKETFITRKWQNINELMDFDRAHGVNATYFIGVNKGLGLSYSQKEAKYWIDSILQNGFEVGLHGICFDNKEGIENEHLTFSRLSGLQSFGIRMHYLRKSSKTLELLANTGYTFDATCTDFVAPYKVGEMVEFPLQIREAQMLYPHTTFCTAPFHEAIELTKQNIDKAVESDLPYLSILFHDRYFSSSFDIWKDWYLWLIEYLIAAGVQFISYNQAVREYLRS